MISAIDAAHILERTRDVWEPLRGERLFITGGTGFVGTWLLASFTAANRAFDLRAQAVVLTRDPEAFGRRAPDLAGDPAIALLRGDAVDFAAPAGTFAYAVHAATQRWFAPDPRRPLGTFDADVTATRRMLEFARDAGVGRLLFTSSGAVYGRQPPDLPRIAETYPGAPLPGDARAAYGEGKRVSEFMCVRYAEQFGFAAIIARLFAFVGPYLPLDEGYAVGNFIGDVLAGGAIRIGGDGTPYRSYLYAADLAVWLWRMLVCAPPNRAYNVGSPDALTVRELAGVVRAAAEADVPIDVARPSDPALAAQRYVPDVGRARDELGLTVEIALPEGVRRTLAWHRHPPLRATAAR